ncbi:DNA translocase FtsK [Chloroflexota bacterium]
MAKRKSRSKRNSRGNPGGWPWWLGLLRFIFLPPGLYFVLVGVIAFLVFYYRQALSSWAAGIQQLLGWGLVFVVLALGTLVVVVWQRKPASFIHHWNRWLGSIAFILAAWGILAFLGLGGYFGLGIIGHPTPGFLGIFIAVLRIAGLVLMGIILVVPRACSRLVAKLISGIGKQFKRGPVPKYLREQLPLPTPPVTRIRPAIEGKPALPPEMEKSIIPPEMVIPKTPLSEKGVAASGLTPAESPKGLRQVAQEVWKKYGESPTAVIIDGWQLPPIDILDVSPEVEFSQADNVQRARLIEEALASYGVEAKVVQINAGPTVTQFGVEPGWDRKQKEIKEKDKDGNIRVRQEEVSKTRVKVERISSLSNDLALALAASSIRIEAPVPGKSIVGIEVPNTVSSVVSLRGVIETSAFQKTEAKSKLSVALGKGAGGEAIAADLAKMPHLLIAGATGSGKTVCLNAIICCLLLYNTPYDVQFIMIDPKRVELTMFNSIPHLAAPVIVDADKAVDVLRWLSQEMNKRYKTLATAAVRNIEGYNKNKQGSEKMSYLVLVIDELADLMMSGGDEVEQILCRLAQLSRAVGIHLVVATQRPSVDVVTGLIKANFPTRISFAVTSQVDSRTILDGGGAEKLLGRGDMLYMPTEAGKPKRLQGCYVSDAEVERLVYLWNSQKNEDSPSLNIEELIPSGAADKKGGINEDPILAAARQLAQEHQHISASFLQRKLRIGYPRAARIMDELEDEKAKGIEDGEGEGEG